MPKSSELISFLYGGDYVEKLKECDIYFFPSFRETTPITLLEAALAGCLPVVADTSAAGEMARVIGGVAIPTETPESLVNGLAHALEDLHKDRTKLYHQSVAVSKAAAENYSETRYRETIRQAYHIASSGLPEIPRIEMNHSNKSHLTP